MAEGRDKQLWAHTSALLAMLANCNSKKRYKPSDFDPTHKPVRIQGSAGDIGMILGKRR